MMVTLLLLLLLQVRLMKMMSMAYWFDCGYRV